MASGGKKSKGPTRLSYVQACRDWQHRSKATTAKAFQTALALPADSKPFTADIIKGHWAAFAGNNAFDLYSADFASMLKYPVEGCRETWGNWFEEFGWVGASRVLTSRQDVTSESCLQFLRHQLSQDSVTRPPEFSPARENLTPWLETGTVECHDADHSRSRRYSAHFRYMLQERNFHAFGCPRKRRDQAEVDEISCGSRICDTSS